MSDSVATRSDAGAYAATDQWRHRLQVGVIYFYFLVPKVNLISVPGALQGIRVEDLLATFLSIWLVRSHRFSSGLRQPLIVALLGIVAGSFLLNLGSATLYRTLAALRIAEYAVVAMAVSGLLSRSALHRLAVSLLLVNTVAAFMQIYGGLPMFASGRIVYETERAYGLTGGSWELGALSVLLFAVVYALRQPRRSAAPWICFLFCCACVYWSASRSAVLALIGVVATVLWNELRKTNYNRRVAVVALSLSVVFITVGASSFFPRMPSVFAAENLAFFIDSVTGTKYDYDGSGSFDVDADGAWETIPGSGGTDESWRVRSVKWASVINRLRAEPSHLIIGFGPGYTGNALDGGLLRGIVEYGVGFLLFLFLLFEALRRRYLYGGAAIFVAFLANLLFIDIHLSSKLMPFLLGVALFAPLACERRAQPARMTATARGNEPP